jgi:hypothetical protein
MPEYLFPKPFPDETVFSVLCRFHLLAAFPNFKNYTLPFLGINAARPNAEFPCCLPRIAEVSGIDVNDLARDLTSIHYYEPFVSSDDYIDAFNALTTGKTKSLQSKLGAIANRIAPGNCLKCCPECMELDNDRYGVAYWHRVHQLIGVTVCPTHYCHLVSQRRSKYSVQFPEIIQHMENGVVEECAMSRLISDEFSDRYSILTREEMVPHYLHQLGELGLLTTNGRVRQKLLRSLLSAKLNTLSKHSSAYQHLAAQCKKECYPECLLYNPDSNHQPVKHFFLIYALFESWSGFTENIRHCTTYCDTRVAPNKIQAQNIEPSWSDALTLLQKGVSMRTVAAKFSTTVSTLKIKAQQKGIAVNVRPKKIFRTEERAIWRKLFIGKKTQVLADEYGVSVGAIEKILSKHPRLKLLRARIWYVSDLKRHQGQIIEYLKFHPTTTRNGIKKGCPASYTWLYKHEKEWLYLNLPKEIPRGQRYLH